MADDIGVRLVLDDGDFLSAMNRVKQNLTTVDQTAQQVNKSIQEGFKGGAEASKDLSDKTKAAADETKKLAAETEQARQGLLAQAKAVSVFGVSINDIQDKLSKLKNTQVLLNASINKGTAAWKLFKVAMAATGIGAFVVALGSVVTLLTQTQRGLDFVSKTGAALGAVLGNVKDSLIAVGDGIVKLFKLDFKGALEEAKKVGKEFASTGEDVKKAWDLKDQSNQLRDANIKLRREIANTRTEIKKLNLVAEDTTKTIKQREEAARKAGALERGLVEKRLALANKEIKILQDGFELSENKAADEERLTELIEGRAAIQQESLELQTTLNNKLNTIRQEGIRTIEEQRKRLEDLTKTLAEQAQEIELQLLDPIERLNAEWELASEGIDKVRQETIGLAESLGKTEEEIAELNRQFDVLQTATDREYKVKIDLEAAKGTQALDTIQSSIDNIPVRDRPELTIEIAEPDTTTFKEKFLDGIVSAFDSPEFRAGLDGAFQIADFTNQLFQGQIEMYEELAAQRQEQIDQLESDLERENELYEKGLANNLETKQKELDLLKTEQDEYNRKANEARKKQIQIETAQNIAQQVSSTGVAIAEVFKAHSGIPFIGIALAAGFVASMLTTIAAANQKVKSLNLYTGAERIGDYTGFVDRGGATDKPNSGSRGYRIVDIATGKPTQAVVGGNEMLLSEDLTHSVGHIMLDAQKNPSLRQQMIEWYANKDASFGFSQGVARMSNYNVTTVGVTDQQLQRVMTKVMDEHFKKYKSYKDAQPSKLFIPNGGGTLITETATKKAIKKFS